MDTRFYFEQDDIFNLVKSASILQSILISRYIINTSSTVNECHVAYVLSMDIVPFCIFGVLEHITWCGVMGFSQPSICVFIFLVQPARFVWQAICTLYHYVTFFLITLCKLIN